MMSATSSSLRSPGQRPGNKRRRARAARAGFTLIEVMVSMSIMVVGALAVIRLQQHTIHANSHARQLSTATEIGQLWIERLKQDAATWTNVGYATGTPTLVQVLAGTTYLRSVNTTPDAFVSMPLTSTTDIHSNGFDFLGRPLAMAANAGQAHFCSSYRTSWVYVGRSLRVDVRVWWARAERNAQITVDFPNCVDNGGIDPAGAFFDAYHAVYLSTVLRHTPN